MWVARMVGKQILHYKILDKIGEGGMGVVYRAEDTRLRRTVAIKMISEQLLDNDRFRERFLREAQAVAALEHPNICTIHEINEFEGQLFIVMQLVRGQTIKDAIGHGPLEIRRSLHLARQMLAGLSHAHQKNIIHRDIKSQNIVLSEHDEIKILDFGLAKWIGVSRTGEWRVSAEFSQNNTTVGTVSYMSPEQALGEETDHRSDIFSLGVVLYELFTGRLPFEGEHFLAVMHSVVDEDPQPPRELRPEIPVATEALILKALEKKPADRFQTAAQMMEALEHVETEWNASHAQPVAIAPRKWVSSRAFAWGVSALLVLAAIFGSYYILNIGRKPVSTLPQQQAVSTPRIAVTYFENQTQDPSLDWMAGGAVETLAMGLAESKQLSVISTQRLHDLLHAPDLKGAARIDRTVATRLATTAGAQTHVYGNISKTPAGLRFTVEMEDLYTGTLLRSFKTDLADSREMLSALENLSQQMRSHLTQTPESKGEPSLVHRLSSSPEATQAYFAGIEKLRRNLKQEALEDFLWAAKLDPGFFLAHYQASQLYLILRDSKSAIASLRRAAENSAAATERDRWYMEALRARLIDLKPDEALRILDELVTTYPTEVAAFSEMALLYRQLKQYDQALEACRRAILIDPYYAPIYANQGYTYLSLNKLNEAIESLGQYSALLPMEANPHDSLGEIYINQGRLADAAREFGEALRLDPNFYPSYRGLAYTLAIQGRLPEALEAGETYLRKVRSDAAKASGRLLVGQMHLAAGRPATARKHFDAALSSFIAAKNLYLEGLAHAYLGHLDLELNLATAARAEFENVLLLARSPEVAAQEFAGPLPAYAQYALGMTALQTEDEKTVNRQLEELQKLVASGVTEAKRWLGYLEALRAARERNWTAVQAALERGRGERLPPLNLSRDATIFLHNQPGRWDRFGADQYSKPGSKTPAADEAVKLVALLSATLESEKRSGRISIYAPADDYALASALESTRDLDGARKAYQRCAEALTKAEAGFPLHLAVTRRLAALDPNRR